jgi:hypothetical protein
MVGPHQKGHPLTARTDGEQLKVRSLGSLRTRPPGTRATD